MHALDAPSKLERRKRAVIIESQRLFVPFLSRALSDVGADLVFVAKRPHARALRNAAPDVVILDAAHSSVAPLNAIRTVRRAAPLAKLVVYANGDAAWCSVARALGADVVLGAEAGNQALRSAVSTV